MLTIVRRTDAEIRRLLYKAANAAESDANRLAPSGIGKIVRKGQFATAHAAIRKTIRNLFLDVRDTVSVGRLDAAHAAFQSSADWEDPLYRAAGLSQKERDALQASTLAMSDRNVELMLRRHGTVQIPLSQQVYRTQALAQGWVDEKINLGIGRGLTAREIGQEVKSLIRPDVKGGVAFAAQRLGRTEVNNSYHAAAIVANADKPWVSGMHWHLSGSHPTKDICDLLAHEDRFDLGSGIFPPGQVPNKPHPQCLCYIVPAIPSEDDFLDSLLAGEYDDFLQEEGGIEPQASLPKQTKQTKSGAKAATSKPQEGRAALNAAPLDINSDKLRANGIPGIDDERAQIAQYKGVMYGTVNGYLRDGSGEFLRENVEKIDSAISKSKLKQDILTFRGVKNPRALFGDRIDGSLVDMEWIDEAFLSTSVDRRIANGFAERTDSPDGGMVLNILVRKGSPMLRLSDFAPDSEKISSTSAEAELLGGRGWKIRVVADNGRDSQGIRQVDVEVISHERSSTNPWDRS